MSTNISVSRAMTVQVDPEKAHRAVWVSLCDCGADHDSNRLWINYYILSSNRALSPKTHGLSRRGIGLHLGMVAFARSDRLCLPAPENSGPGWRQGNPRHC